MQKPISKVYEATTQFRILADSKEEVVALAEALIPHAWLGDYEIVVAEKDYNSICTGEEPEECIIRLNKAGYKNHKIKWLAIKEVK